MRNQIQYMQAIRRICNSFSLDITQAVLWMLSFIGDKLGDRTRFVPLWTRHRHE